MALQVLMRIGLAVESWADDFFSLTMRELISESERLSRELERISTPIGLLACGGVKNQDFLAPPQPLQFGP